MSSLKKRIEACLIENSFDVQTMKTDRSLSTIIDIFMKFLTKIHPVDRPEINLYDMHIKLFMQSPTQEILALLSRLQADYYYFMINFHLNDSLNSNQSRRNEHIDHAMNFLLDESQRLCGMNIFPKPEIVSFIVDTYESCVKYFEICKERLNLAVIAMRPLITDTVGGINLLHDVACDEDLSISIGKYPELKKAIHAHMKDLLGPKDLPD